jgi:N4-gp56 family major capsid protein
MATSTTSTNSANLHVYYEKKLLSTLEPRLVLFNLGKKQRLPKGNGKQVKWLRYARIASSLTPLTEGTAPSEISFTTSNVTADVEQFGQFVKISDMLSDTAIDPVLENVMERLGRAAATTVEDLIVAEVDAQAAIQRVNNAANDAAITAADVLNHKELIEAMISQKADFIGPHESGSYVAVIHPSNQFDLLVDTQTGSWLDINKFVSPAQDKLMNGEFGRLYGSRLLVSDRMTAIASTVSVKRNYMIGEEAYGVVELDGRSLEMIQKDNKSGGVSNPLNQFATVGYKIHGFKAKYLEASSKRVIQIRAASAL